MNKALPLDKLKGAVFGEPIALEYHVVVSHIGIVITPHPTVGGSNHYYGLSVCLSVPFARWLYGIPTSNCLQLGSYRFATRYLVVIVNCKFVVFCDHCNLLSYLTLLVRCHTCKTLSE